MFLFNYFFSEFEFETGKSHDLDIFHRTALLETNLASEVTSGSSISILTSRKTSALSIDNQTEAGGHSSETSLTSRSGSIYIERF